MLVKDLSTCLPPPWHTHDTRVTWHMHSTTALSDPHGHFYQKQDLNPDGGAAETAKWQPLGACTTPGCFLSIKNKDRPSRGDSALTVKMAASRREGRVEQTTVLARSLHFFLRRVCITPFGIVVKERGKYGSQQHVVLHTRWYPAHTAGWLTTSHALGINTSPFFKSFFWKKSRLGFRLFCCFWYLCANFVKKSI